MAFSAFTAHADLVTSAGQILDPVVIDFNAVPAVSSVAGPIQVGDAVALDVTLDGVPNSGLYVYDSGWGLCDNGNWESTKTTFVGGNGARPGSIRFSFNDGPVSAVGGFMNHAPCESQTMVINAYDSSMALLESYDITADAVTPNGVNAGVFRGIFRPSADIAYFEVYGGVPVLDDLTFGGGAIIPPAAEQVPVPTLGNLGLLLMMLLLGGFGWTRLRRS